MSEGPIYVGIIGYGKIGTGTLKTLLDNQENIDRKVGRQVRVKRLVDVDWTSPRPFAVSKLPLRRWEEVETGPTSPRLLHYLTVTSPLIA